MPASQTTLAAIVLLLAAISSQDVSLAGPGTPPGGRGIACGSRFQLGDDNRYRLVAWGPAGPDPEDDHVMQGEWRVANVRVLLSHQDQTHACQVTWMADNLLVIEPLNGKGRAEYERTDAVQDRPDAVEGEQDRESSDR